MLCPRCYGKHIVFMNGARVPCPECAGVGEIHCCDGLREQVTCAPAAAAVGVATPFDDLLQLPPGRGA